MEPATNPLAPLESAGIYVDEIQKLRVFDPNALAKANELKQETSGFTEQIGNFKKMTNDFIESSDKVQNGQ